MGLSIACGLALSDRERRVYVLISDAELNEGSTWEALMFAGHNHLRNLYLFVDLNGQQATGRTQDIMDVRSIWSSAEISDGIVYTGTDTTHASGDGWKAV